MSTEVLAMSTEELSRTHTGDSLELSDFTQKSRSDNLKAKGTYYYSATSYHPTAWLLVVYYLASQF